MTKGELAAHDWWCTGRSRSLKGLARRIDEAITEAVAAAREHSTPDKCADGQCVSAERQSDGRWRCPSCGREFVPLADADAAIAADADAALARVNKLIDAASAVAVDYARDRARGDISPRNKALLEAAATWGTRYRDETYGEEDAHRWSVAAALNMLAQIEGAETPADKEKAPPSPNSATSSERSF